MTGFPAASSSLRFQCEDSLEMDAVRAIEFGARNYPVLEIGGMDHE